MSTAVLTSHIYLSVVRKRDYCTDVFSISTIHDGMLDSQGILILGIPMDLAVTGTVSVLSEHYSATSLVQLQCLRSSKTTIICMPAHSTIRVCDQGHPEKLLQPKKTRNVR
jgi:hypothetical protein